MVARQPIAGLKRGQVAGFSRSPVKPCISSTIAKLNVNVKMISIPNIPLQNTTNLRIGEVAARTGLTPRAIRYYEQIGLLPATGQRAKGRHRHYDADDLEQLELITGLRDLLGLSLDEVHGLVAAGGAWFAPHRPWEASASMMERSAAIDEALAQVDLQLARVRSRAAALGELEQRLHARRLAIQSKRLT